ncbi:hypothetical protein B0J14DRAFT_570293 [Halenospora varia]|nr:hypothetical protein B0J14DRAFT_570293 [Halenospora varia]
MYLPKPMGFTTAHGKVRPFASTSPKRSSATTSMHAFTSNSFNANHIIYLSKFVDSHLKPYRCKALACENLHFSSTACLLRHEREAHAMHGSGDKPFLCTHDGCDRGVLGNGFPRHWNLRDHMKRVHNDVGQPESNASGSPPASGAARGKKCTADENVKTRATGDIYLRLNYPPVVVHQPQELQRIKGK